MYHSNTCCIYKAQLRYFMTDSTILVAFFLQMGPEIALTNPYLKVWFVIRHHGGLQMLLLMCFTKLPNTQRFYLSRI